MFKTYLTRRCGSTTKYGSRFTCKRRNSKAPSCSEEWMRSLTTKSNSSSLFELFTCKSRSRLHLAISSYGYIVFHEHRVALIHVIFITSLWCMFNGNPGSDPGVCVGRFLSGRCRNERFYICWGSFTHRTVVVGSTCVLATRIVVKASPCC